VYPLGFPVIGAKRWKPDFFRGVRVAYLTKGVDLMDALWCRAPGAGDGSYLHDRDALRSPHIAVVLLLAPCPKNSHGPPLEPRKHDEGTRVEKDVSLVIPSIVTAVTRSREPYPGKGSMARAFTELSG